MRKSNVLKSSLLTFALVAPLSVVGSAVADTVDDPAADPAHEDVPGTRYLITTEDLAEPAPADDPEVAETENPPTIVDGPDGALPDVPEGFVVEEFARELDQPRVLRLAPNGDIFIAESGTGRVLVYDDDASPGDEPDVFAEGLDRPFGIAFYPADEPEYVYVGAADQVVRYPYATGDREATGEVQVIVGDIPTERHWTRDLAVAADGEHLFVSIGSASNLAGEMSDAPEGGIDAWEAEYGRGAAWDDETNRAVVRVFDPEGETVSNYATGLRNCSGMTVHPDSGDLWCTGNERDGLGPDVVPDYLTRVVESGFYGWPWYYAGGLEDPTYAGDRPDLADEVQPLDVLIQAHSSTMQIVFYDHDAFPEEYHGDAFATLRGSWNREERTGYKVVRAIFEDGEATGEYENFMTGFVLDEDAVWGRPTGIVVTQDGDLLVSDDENGTVFRVSAEEASAPDPDPEPGPDPEPEPEPGPAPLRYGFFLTNGWTGGDADHAFVYGRHTDEVLVGDWDGDGTDSLTVRRGNQFHVNNHPRGGPAESVFTYGRPGDVILVGDWNGDGTDTLAVRRGDEYHVKNSLEGGEADVVIQYGRAADTVLVGDWNGDGNDTFAVRRGATYHVKNSLEGGDADAAFTYGRVGDEVLAGDWDGDGKDTFTVRRGKEYHVNNSLSSGEADLVVRYGREGDIVLVGDWDGDGTDTLGVRRTP